MRLAFALLTLISAIPGGYKFVELTDPHVTAVHEFLNTNVPKLFPNVEGEVIIQYAEIQIVAGYKLRLHIAGSHGLAFTIVLYVDPSQNIKVTAVRPRDTSHVIGGYKWVDPKTLEAKDLGSVMMLLREEKGFTGEASTVLAMRTQVVSGLNTHVIFVDGEGIVHAAVVYHNPRQEGQVTFYNTIS
jgi:hypothetical protein